MHLILPALVCTSSTLVRGDNLEEMRKFPDDCIDLIATDPPFNSKRDYFVPYRDERGQEPDTLIRAFTDTWTWGEAAEEAYGELIVEVGGQIGDTVQGYATIPKRNADDGIPRHDGYQDRRNEPDPQTHRKFLSPLRFSIQPLSQNRFGCGFWCE